MSFERAEDLRKAFDMVDQTNGLRFVRVKNNLHPEFDAPNKSFGYG